MISSEEISVVLRGAVDENILHKSLLNIKKFLPGAQVIISTWQGTVIPEEYSELYDKLILSKDPGAFHNDKDNVRFDMLFRIIKACVEGVNAADRKYVLSMRSDLLLSGTGILKYFDKFNKRDPKYSLAEHKIVINSYTTTIFAEEGKVKHPTPYLISDWWHFGLKHDIQLLYDVDKVEDLEAHSRYFDTHERSKKYHMYIVDQRFWRYCPEQYIGKCFANKKFPNLDFPDFLSYDNVDLKEALKFTIDNFIILDIKQSDMRLMKEPYIYQKSDMTNVNDVLFRGLIRFPVYRRLYKKYFVKSLDLNLDIPLIKWYWRKWFKKKRKK